MTNIILLEERVIGTQVPPTAMECLEFLGIDPNEVRSVVDDHIYYKSNRREFIPSLIAGLKAKLAWAEELRAASFREHVEME